MSSYSLSAREALIRILASVFLLSLLSSCSGHSTSKLNFNPSEPIRIAILPFVYKDSTGQISETMSGALGIDHVSILSRELTDEPSVLMRRFVTAELGKSFLQLVPQRQINVELPHRGFGREVVKKDESEFNLKKLYSTDPLLICSDFLDCDAVMYGYITKWDRSYFAIQSISTVGIEVKIVSGRDRSTLFEASIEDSDSRGITKGPTGISDLVVEPVRGLDSDIIETLARNVVRKMLRPLLLSDRTRDSGSIAPPSIYAASHDAKNGTFERPGPLTVLMFGSEGGIGTFSIGTAIEHIPMIERVPGHYVGEFFPLSGDEFSDAPVSVQLTDKQGRTVNQVISRAPISLKRN